MSPDWSPYEDDGDIGPVIREQAMRRERTRWVDWLKVAIVVVGMVFIRCFAGAAGGRPWCD